MAFDTSKVATTMPKVDAGPDRAGSLLPDPEPRQIVHTIISVDDHLVEPPNTFEGRLPAALQDRAPKIVEDEDGHQFWAFDGKFQYQIGLNAVAGRARDTWSADPRRFDEIRKGSWSARERVGDMDIDGVWGSVCFPSAISGFCGRVYAECSDPELGLATTKAWNDWFFEEWFSVAPERFIPMGITYLGDAEQGAAEVYRNAERGFTAITLPEAPHNTGLPDLYDREFWEPIIRACSETDTTICLHTGSSGLSPVPPGATGLPIPATLFPMQAYQTTAFWLWSGFPSDYPNLKIALSEGGFGWVAMLIDRLTSMCDRSGFAYMDGGVQNLLKNEHPVDVLRRNFWYCSLDDPSTLDTRYTVGIDKIMVESDYPHADSTWPDSQSVFSTTFGRLPAEERAMFSHENAAALFKHPLPPDDSPHAAGLRSRLLAR